MVGTRAARDGAWRCWLPPVLVVALAIILYWPAVTSDFVTDDYSFLSVARGISGDELIRSVLGASDVPWTEVSYSWRPFSLLSFVGLHELFGDSPVPYHLVLLGGHLAAIVLVWNLARRFAGGWRAPTLAAVVFGLHPIGFESVTWIAAINSLALPFALGAWLLVLDHDRARSWSTAAAVVLFATALGFRETIGVLLVGMIGVQLVRSTRHDWRRRLAPLSVLVPLVVAAMLLSTGAAARSQTQYGQLRLDGLIERWWRHLEWALVPVVDPGLVVVDYLQHIGAVALVALPLAMIATQRWTPAALAISFHAFVIVYALAGADHPRYFYFPSALLGLSVGAAVGLSAARSPRPGRSTRPTRAIGVAAIAALALTGTVLGHRDVASWSVENPAAYADLSHQLRSLTDVDDGDSVLVANVPVSIVLFNGFYLPYIEDRVWPDIDVSLEVVAVEDLDLRRAFLTEGQHLVVFDPGSGGCAAYRRGEAGLPQSAVFQLDVQSFPAGPTSTSIVQIGPYDGQWGTVSWQSDGERFRFQVAVPWVPAVSSRWRPMEIGRPVRVAVVASRTAFTYDVIVDGDRELSFGALHSSNRGVAAVGLDASDPKPFATGVTMRRLVSSPCRPPS